MEDKNKQQFKTAERWWTFPAQAESGMTVMVTGRDNVERQRRSGKFTNRVDVTWNYDAQPDGMPCPDDSILMGEATDTLIATFKKDKSALLTGIYTGDGRRDWVFYVRNLRGFSIAFNKALASLRTMPLAIEAYADPDWEEYDEMREATYVAPDDEE